MVVRKVVIITTGKSFHLNLKGSFWESKKIMKENEKVRGGGVSFSFLFHFLHFLLTNEVHWDNTSRFDVRWIMNERGDQFKQKTISY